MKKIQILLGCLLFVFSYPIHAQVSPPAIEWQKSFGGSLFENAFSIKQTTDGGYIVAVYSLSNDGDITGSHGQQADYWIVKLTSNGNIQWQKSLGGTGTEFVRSVQQTSDGGYIVSGNSNSTDGDVTGNQGATDYWIVKLNGNGDIQWQKSLGGTRSESANSIEQTPDGGYIVAGGSGSNDGDVTGSHPGGDCWIVKLDEFGNIVWQKCLGGSQGDAAYGIRLTSGGGYIVLGITFSNDGDVRGNHGNGDYWLAKLDGSGNLQWQKCLGGSGAEEVGNAVEQTSDGGYIIAGYSNSNDSYVTGNHGAGDYCIFKVDSSGTVEWQKSLGGTNTEYALSVKQTTDGGYIVAGYAFSNDGDVTGNHGDGRDMWVVKLNSSGALYWQKSVGGEIATSVEQTADGAYILAGSAYSNDPVATGNQGGSDCWVVKLGSQADTATCVPPNIIITGDTTSCNSVTLTASGGVSYLWSGGDTPDSATNTFKISDTYSVQVTNASGCKAVSSKHVIVAIPLTVPPTNLLPADNSINLNASVIFSWVAVPGALVYDLYIWKSADPMPSAPVVANITEINYPYNSGLRYATNYNWKVVARNEACNVASTIQNFTTRSLADFIATNVQNPPSAFSGQAITVQWQIKNTGQGGTLNQPWFDVVYLSNDLVLDIKDIKLGDVPNLSELPAGASYTQNGTFTLPQGITGNYYIFVATNIYANQVLESDYTNNTGNSATATFVQLTPPADLRVTSIIHPNFIFSGNTIDLTYTVTNTGTGTTVADTWKDNIYLSDDSILTSPAISVTTSFFSDGPLAADSSYTRTQSVTIPQGISGRYYFFIKTDNDNQVYEHAGDDNNITRSDSVKILLTPPVDLAVTQIILPESASNNESILVKWRIENNGGSSSGNNGWIDNIYISKTTPFNPDSSILLTSVNNPVSLSPGEGSDSQGNITIPSNITGDYYIYVKADVYNSVYEYTFESNNTLRSNVIRIKSPDLIVSGIVIPLQDSSGKFINVSWTVKNNDSGILYTSNIIDKIFISKRSAYHKDSVTEVGMISYTTGELVKGDSLQRTMQVQIPNGISGNYYAYINTEDSDTVHESNENNNMTRSASFLKVTLSPSPDLRVTSIALPDSAAINDIIPLSFNVKNIGAAAVMNTYWTDRIYLSQQSTWPASDSIFISEVAQLRSLGVNASYDVSAAVKIPANLTDSSRYYLYIVADATNNIYEHNAEPNNYLEKDSIFIKKYPPVDLAVTDISGPVSGSSGKPITVNFSVKNIGQAQTLQSQWQDALYLSADSIWDITGDILVKEIIHNGILDAGSSYSITDNIALPNGVSGNYYLLMVTDHNDLNRDANKSNNYRLLRSGSTARTITIALTPPPDLVVTSFTIPLEGAAGQPVMVRYTITNKGTGPAGESSWTDKVYLSTNQTLDANDGEIGTINHSTILNAGQSYSDSVQVFLPIQASGNYAIIIKTDDDNTVFEHTGENNNTANAYIIINMPLLSDLLVSGITLPAPPVNAGEAVTIEWKIKNSGANPATGYMKEAVYLSEDTVKSANDILIASPFTHINLAPQTELDRSFTGGLAGVSLKEYHVLVYTDVLNNIYESNDSNNITASAGKLTVNISSLPLNVLTKKGLVNDNELYYRIVIPDSLQGESLLITLKGDSANGTNEMYASFSNVPTKAVYDFSQAQPFAGNQEIIIPVLQPGTYYLMMTGKTSSAATQKITVLATVLPFEIRNVDTDKGGNNGNITLRVTGSKLANIASLKLVKGSSVITADAIRIIDPTILFGTFNLKGAQLGIYDLVAENAVGQTAILPRGFEIITGTPPDLLTNVIASRNSRRFQIITLTVEFSNAGNTDLVNPVLKLTSLAGDPIGFNVSDLANDVTELMLPLQEVNGPPGILRAGANGTIMVYAKTLQFSLSFNLVLPDIE